MGYTDKTSMMIQSQTLCVYERTWYSLCVHVFVLLSVVYLCVQWHGAEGSLFQHQQADESLGPNSLEAELALLLFFSLCLRHKQTLNLKFRPNRTTVPATSSEF